MNDDVTDAVSDGVNDPVGLAVIDALARRAAAQQGPAREWLLQRVAQLQAARGAAASAVPPAHGAPAAPTALAALREQVDRLGRRPPGAARAAVAGLAHEAPPLKAVAAFKGTWTRLRAEQRLRQALAQVPAKAGPLHSAQVVHRALLAIQGLSPAYLDAFMAQVDTLLALEQGTEAGDPLRRPPGRGGSRAGARHALALAQKTPRTTAQTGSAEAADVRRTPAQAPEPVARRDLHAGPTESPP